jgi:predicted alpha-1,2-mannosidase
VIGNFLKELKMSWLRLPVFFLLTAVTSAAFAQSAYDSVDPVIGTSGDGNTFPGASLPFGMVQWSPDTGDNGWYFYNKTKIYGFGMTHLSGAGCPLYGDVPILPITQELTASPATALESYAQSFDHTHEEAHPGYYTVTLGDGIEVSLTATDRAGIARIHFPQGSASHLLVNSGGSANSDVHIGTLPPVGREHDGSEIKVTDDNAITGSTTSGGFCGSPTRYTLYFAAKFERPFTGFSTWNGDAIQKNQRDASGKHTGAWLDFGNQHEVQLKIGISYVSEANALANLNKEIPGWNFDEVRAQARSTWAKLLDQVAVEGGTPDQRKIFYTGLYHMLLAPNLFSDDNGDYIGFDWKVRALASTTQ